MTEMRQREIMKDIKNVREWNTTENETDRKAETESDN